jgi:hypothetical protein
VLVPVVEVKTCMSGVEPPETEKGIDQPVAIKGPTHRLRDPGVGILADVPCRCVPGSEMDKSFDDSNGQ